MTVTVPIPMTQEEQATLLAHAKARGVSVDSLLRKAVLEVISSSPEEVTTPQQQIRAEELDQAFEEIADMIPDGIPPLPKEALSRESIYTREDEWRQ
jgi:hypothetical protein